MGVVQNEARRRNDSDCRNDFSKVFLPYHVRVIRKIASDTGYPATLAETPRCPAGLWLRVMVCALEQVTHFY